MFVQDRGIIIPKLVRDFFVQEAMLDGFMTATRDNTKYLFAGAASALKNN